jgi:2-polyprenyl-6-methoxyphenol hydroxylase-like FAD-dependent oxidoreductase
MDGERSPQSDVVVVGARCAGAATALQLARQGHDVTLVDRVAFPSDTLSTHVIARGGVVLLDQWGLLDAVDASGAPPLRTVEFHVEGEIIQRPIKDKAGVDHLTAPRRHVLDHLLVRAAVDAGATLRTGISVTGVVREGGRVTGVLGRDADGAPVRHDARFVVGADGLRTSVARAVGAPIVESRPASGATHYTYFRGPEWGAIEMHIAPGVMAGVFPTHSGEANVWACTPAATTSRIAGQQEDEFLQVLATANPALAERMAGAERMAPIRGAIGLPNHVRVPWGPGWALVGDAGMHRDPVTGHGITDAFRDAELLARALDGILGGELSEAAAGRAYRDLRHDLGYELFDATARMAQFPPVEEFVAQQLRAQAAIEVEAQFLSELAPWPARLAAVA